MLSAWIKAFRLRTLPLSFSSIILGNGMAYYFLPEHFSWSIFVLSCMTTLFLQILSNLANDYGDFEKGTDNESRIGPERALQSGAITPQAMKKAIWIFAALSLFSGVGLLMKAFEWDQLLYLGSFLLLGIFAIWAAINYTSGSVSYGYRALGDVFVFIFFGITGVVGSYYLQTKSLDPILILPTITMGTFSVGVLNINNLRDLDPDKEAGKTTIPVILGRSKGKVYHSLLLSTGLVCNLVLMFEYFDSVQQYLCMGLPFFVIMKNIFDIFLHTDPQKLNPKLRNLALGTFLYVILFIVSLTLL